MTSIISRGGQALEESDSDGCRTAIVDIIRMGTDVMRVIREDYRLPHVQHGGGRPPAQSRFARLSYVRGRWTSRRSGRFISRPLISPPVSPSLQPPPPLQSPTSLDPPSVQLPISSNPPSVPTTPPVDPLSLHLDASLGTSLGQIFTPSTIPPPESSIFVPVHVQSETSTKLHLPQVIPKGRRRPRRPRLLPPPPLLPVPSQTDVHHISHVDLVPTTVREGRPKRKRVPVIHRFSPCGGI